MYAAVLALIGLTLCAITACSPLGGDYSPLPSDTELEKVFYEHEVEFDELVTMYDADSKQIVLIAPDVLRLENSDELLRTGEDAGLPKERWEEYRRRFASLHLKSGIRRRLYFDGYLLTVASRGTAIDSYAKGYAYSRKELSPLSESLDSSNYKRTPEGFAFKKLRRNWYLYHF